MNIRLGNLDFKDIVDGICLKKIQYFLDTNGFKKEDVCENICNEYGNYHIFEMPRELVICGMKKSLQFVDFIRSENLTEKFIGRVQVSCMNKK